MSNIMDPSATPHLLGISWYLNITSQYHTILFYLTWHGPNFLIIILTFDWLGQITHLSNAFILIKFRDHNATKT